MNEPFQFSTLTSYQAAVHARASGDFATARIEYRRCLEVCESRGAGHHYVSDLLLRLGDVEALDGNSEGALESYQDAMAADPTSPLVLVYVAASLVDLLANPRGALDKLERAEELIDSGVWQPVVDDLSEREYRTRIAEIRGRALAAGNEA